jgi:RNA polymerase sigma factor (sigma-70 family)
VDKATDQDLLREYADSRSEAAFAELVQRHIGFVYAAAFRMVRDDHHAKDVTQGVFVALARTAPQLKERPTLSGWLHRTAQNIAAHSIRTEVRRRRLEEESAAMNDHSICSSEASLDQVAKHLDEALGEMSESDRDALLLRYFERKSAREMAGILGLNAEAAQKRVSRAVEHLRDLLAKRGVTLGAGSLVAVLSSIAAQSAPSGLAATVAGVLGLAGASAQSATTLATPQILAMATLKKTLIITVAAVAPGTAAFEAYRASDARAEIQRLQNS